MQEAGELNINKAFAVEGINAREVHLREPVKYFLSKGLASLNPGKGAVLNLQNIAFCYGMFYYCNK